MLPEPSSGEANVGMSQPPIPAAPVQATCPACKTAQTVEPTAAWWQCGSCRRYVRNMVCPITNKIVKVHSKKTKAELYKCPSCGKMHKTIPATEATRHAGLSLEQLQTRQSGQSKPNLGALKESIRASIQANLEPGETVEVAIVGQANQSLVGTERRAFIVKQGILTGGFLRKQSTSWDYRNISGVELQRSMTMTAVILQVPGVAPVTEIGRFSKGPGSVWEAPNAVVTGPSPGLEQSVTRLRELIAEAQQPRQGAAAQPQENALDQIKKLAELRDAGIITEEEFDAKKKKFLDSI